MLGFTVKAQVVDIRSRASRLPQSVLADANILYLVHYDYSALSADRQPQPHQARHYPAWYSRAIQGGVEIGTSSSCVREFVHLIERTELEILWGTDPNRQELDPRNPGQAFSPKYIKRARYLYASQLAALRQRVGTTVRSMRKSVATLPERDQVDQILDRLMTEWLSSAADVADAELVAAAKGAGMPRIISDDADLASFDGITLYTANRNVIDAAQAVGKLG